MSGRFSRLYFLFLLPFLLYAQEVKVLSSSASGVTVEYSPAIHLDSLKIDGQTFLTFDFPFALEDENLKPGEPLIQYRAFDFGVPNQEGNSVEILQNDFTVIKGQPIFRAKLVKKKGFFVDDFSTEEIKPLEREVETVKLGQFGIVRGLPVQTVRVYPYSPLDGNRIKILKKIIFRINFFNGKAKENYGYKDKYLSDVVLNYNVAKRWIKHSVRIKKSNTNSVLAGGTWFKFPITKEGIYKISYSDLKNYGIDPETVDPRTIKIFNNGGYMLPWGQDDPVPTDLVENAILVKGEDDGKFDKSDYILFYARGTDFFEADNSTGGLKRMKDYYTHKNYYFITSGGLNGKRMQKQNSLNENIFYSQTETRAAAFHEDDKINIIKSGVIYLGDDFSPSNNSRTYVTSLPGIVPNSTIVYTFDFVNNYSAPQTLRIFENQKQIFSGTIPGAFGWSVAGERSSYFYFTGTLKDNRSVLDFVYDATSVSSKGYLNYFEIYYDKILKSYDDQLMFYSKDTSSVIEYTLMNFSNSSIFGFNVTDYSSVKLIEPKMLSGGEFVFQANERSGNIQKYYVLNSSKFLTPPKAEKVENSDLHGFTEGAEYVIITVKDFKDAAERLAQYRENDSPTKLKTKIVFMCEIYNEFSSGNLDPTAIRNFLKYAYENWQTKPFYVLLFGDGDYDYLNIEGQNKNFVPVYETRGSFDEVYSYPYDDYYARIVGNDKKADLAIGRINVDSPEEANDVVDKIVYYETMKKSEELWNSRITLVADDGLTSKGNDGSEHTAQSETLARYHIPPYFDLNKLYLSMFPTVNTGLGRRKPQVNEEIINAINNGTLILNFVGHGNPEVWTHEVVFDRDVTIPQLKNDKYFFLLAATCDFGRYDDPTIPSGTELMLVKKNAGTIGTIAASRPVYSQSNAKLAYDFFDNLLMNRDKYDLPRTLGRAYYLLKRNRTSQNDEKYHLFGDPALRLNIPRLPVKIDSVNGVAEGLNVQLKALGNAKIDGIVVDDNGKRNYSVNGKAIISVYDSKRTVYLSDINYNVEIQGGLLFRGQVTVSDGKFVTDFVIPKDISYENKNGKIISYFFNEETDGIGYNSNFVVGGTDSSFHNDGKGPDIQIYFDNLNNDNSYLVNPDFRLLVKLNDETGLNTTGTGVGHKLEAVLNDNEAAAIDLTKYFIGDLNAGGKSGLVNYRFSELTPGEYKLKIKAWDVFNNLSTEQTYFQVVEGSSLVIRDVLNYPNPFENGTTFTFQHNLNEPVDVTIRIYTVAGRMIKKIDSYDVTSKFVKIHWDGRDEDGNGLANGTYLYKLTVKAVNGGFKQNFLGKLAVIR